MYLKALAASITILSAALVVEAQQADSIGHLQELIIRKTDDKSGNMIIRIENGKYIIETPGKRTPEDVGYSVRVSPKMSISVVPGSPMLFGYGNTSIPSPPTLISGFLGVTHEDDDKSGAKINSVSKGSPAQKVGIQAGDVIIKIDDIEIRKSNDLTAFIRKTKPEEKVKVTIRKQDGKTETKEVKLSSSVEYMMGNITITTDSLVGKLEDLNFNNFRSITINRTSRAPLGIKVQDLEYEVGVKIIEIESESIAEKSGLKLNDIITAIDGKRIETTEQLSTQYRYMNRSKNIFNITVTRNGKTEDIEIKIPKPVKTISL